MTKAYIYILICFILIASAFGFGLLFPGEKPVFPDQPPENKSITYPKITNDSSNPILRRIINVTQYINQTIIYNQTHIINETVYYHANLTEIQMKYLKNMKPKTCGTIACSEGFFQAKKQMFDILSIKQPKFEERPSIGYDPFADTEFDYNESYTFVRHNDGYGDYILFNSSFWYFTMGLNYTIIQDNESIHNYTEYNFNLSDIKLRRIE